MSRRIQIGAASLMLAAIVVMALVGWTYRRNSNRYQLAYTRAVKERDISDTARNAASALQDAELRIQDYVLTGETSYSEAYLKDIQDWQDESGTLELLAQHNVASTQVRDFLKNGMRVANELEQILSLYDAGSRDAAMEGIRKGSGIVYLEEARDAAGQIREADGLGADYETRELVNVALGSSRHLAAGAAVLFCLTLAGTVLLILEGRRERRSPGNPESAEKRSVTAAR